MFPTSPFNPFIVWFIKFFAILAIMMAGQFFLNRNDFVIVTILSIMFMMVHQRLIFVASVHASLVLTSRWQREDLKRSWSSTLLIVNVINVIIF